MTIGNRKAFGLCVLWAVVWALIGVAGLAWGQETQGPTQAAATTGGSDLDTLVHLLSGGGLPAVLAAVAAYVVKTGGFPVSLSEADRLELRKFRRAMAGKHVDDEEDSEEPKK